MSHIELPPRRASVLIAATLAALVGACSGDPASYDAHSYPTPTPSTPPAHTATPPSPAPTPPPAPPPPPVGPKGPVSGRVLGPNGPAVGLAMVVGGQKTSTDATGKFSVSDVPSTYDVVMVSAANAGLHHVTAFEDLTAREITLNLPFDVPAQAPAPTSTAIVHVTPPSASMLVLADGVSPPSVGDDGRLSFSWTGTGDVHAHLRLMLYTTDETTGAPIAYTDYAEATVPLAPNTDVPLPVTWGAPPFDTQMVTATVTPPPGASGTLGAAMHWTLNGVPAGTLAGSFSADRVSFPVPSISGLDYTLQISATGTAPTASTGASSSRIVASAAIGGNVTLLPFDAPTRIDRATPISSATTFDWLATPGVPTQLTVPMPGTSTDYVIYTSWATAHLPDASALGVPFPSSGCSGASWTVSQTCDLPAQGTLGATGQPVACDPSATVVSQPLESTLGCGTSGR